MRRAGAGAATCGARVRLHSDVGRRREALERAAVARCDNGKRWRAHAEAIVVAFHAVCQGCENEVRLPLDTITRDQAAERLADRGWRWRSGPNGGWRCPACVRRADGGV